jgi:hypothetical protein
MAIATSVRPAPKRPMTTSANWSRSPFAWASAAAMFSASMWPASSSA